MGLKDYLGGIDLWRTGDEAKMPVDDRQRAQSSIYLSDYLAYMRSRGHDVDNPNIAAAAIAKLTDEVERRNAVAAQEDAQSSREKAPVLGKLSALLALSPQAQQASAHLGAQAISHGMNAISGGDKSLVLPRAAIVDDLSESKQGEEGRYLRRVATGEESPEVTPIAGRLAAKTVSGLSGGRVALPANYPEDGISKVEESAGNILELAGAAGFIIGVSRGLGAIGAPAAASGPLAIGLHGAVNPAQDTLFKRVNAMIEGTALGLAIGGAQAGVRGAARTAMGEMGPARVSLEKFLATEVSRTLESGQVGVALTAYEKIKHGEVPTAQDLLEGFIGFAGSHSIVAGVGRLSPSGVALAEGTRRAKRWAKSDSPDARALREAEARGDWETLMKGTHGKIREFTEQVLAERSGGTKPISEPMRERVAKEAEALGRIGKNRRDRVTAEEQKRTEKEVEQLVSEHEQALNEIRQEQIDRAYAQDALDRGPVNAEVPRTKADPLVHTPAREFTGKEAVEFLEKEVGLTRTEANRVKKQVASEIGGLGKLNEDALRMAGQEVAANRSAAVAAENAQGIKLKTYATEAAARGAATKENKRTGNADEYVAYQNQDGRWEVAKRPQAVDATKGLPASGKEPRGPSQAIDEILALRKLARNDKGPDLSQKRPQNPEKMSDGQVEVAREQTVSARQQRIAEAKAAGEAIRRAAAETNTPPPRRNELSDSEIVAVARERGGVDRLLEAGYTKADIVRAVGETKREAFKNKTGVSNDVTLGMGLGGGQGQFLEAMGLAVRGSAKGAVGLVRGGLWVSNGLTEVVNRAMTPYDYAAESVNKIVAKHLTSPMETRIKAVGAELDRTLYKRVPGYGSLLHFLREHAAIRYMSDPEVQGSLRRLVGEKAVVSYKAGLVKDKIDKAEAGALKVLNDVRKAAGLKEHSPEYFSALMYGVIQYGARTANGSRPGYKVIEAQIQEAARLGIQIPANRMQLARDVIDMVKSLDQMPAEIRGFVAEIHNLNRQLWETRKSAGLSGETYTVGKNGGNKPWKKEAAAKKYADSLNAQKPDAKARVVSVGDGVYMVEAMSGARLPGMAYMPESRLESTKSGNQFGNMGVRGRRQSGMAVNGPEAHQKSVEGGLFERMFIHGQSPDTFSPGELYRRSQISTMGAIENRAFVTELMGRTFIDKRTGEELPAATTMKTVNAIRKGGGAEWAKMRDYVEELGTIPGLKYGKDTLLLHPEVFQALKNITEAPYGNRLTKMNAWLKKAKLAWSPFHFWALGVNTLAYGENPVKAMREWETILKDPRVPEYLRGSFTLGESDVYHANIGYERVFGEARFDRSPVKNFFGKTESWIDRQLWDKMYRSTKIVSMHNAVRQLEMMGMDRQSAVEAASKQINSLHGGINWHWEGISSKSKQFASMFLLAPDWVISNTTWALMPFRPTKTGAVARNALVRHAMITYTFGNVMNMMLSGKPMWENDEGHKHHIQSEIGGKTLYLDMHGHMAETYRVALGAVNSVLPADKEILQNYDRNPIDWLRGKGSPLVRGGAMLYTGQADFPPGYALPTAKDLWEGRSKGKYGGRQRNLDALAIGVARMGLPISADGAISNMADAGGLRAIFSGDFDAGEFFTDHRFLSGLSGRHVYEAKEGGRSGGASRRSSSRGSGSRSGSWRK